MLILHANVGLAFTIDQNWSGWSELRDCKNAITQVPGNEQGVIFYALAVWPFGIPRMKAISFGIKYSSMQVGPVAQGPCFRADQDGNFENAQGSWPQSGSGTALVFANPLTDSINEIYWFASYAYNGNTFEVTAHPDQRYGGYFSDDEIPGELDPIEDYGMLGFGNKNGFNPCGGDAAQGGCCTNEGVCYVRTKDQCNSSPGFIYEGDNSACYPNPCTPGIGACCFGPKCKLLSWDDCINSVGTFYWGKGCDPTPCTASNVYGNWGAVKSYYRSTN